MINVGQLRADHRDQLDIPAARIAAPIDSTIGGIFSHRSASRSLRTNERKLTSGSEKCARAAGYGQRPESTWNAWRSGTAAEPESHDGSNGCAVGLREIEVKSITRDAPYVGNRLT